MDKGFVNVLVGVSAIKSVYEQTLQAKAVDFVCLSVGYDRVLGGWFDGEYSASLKASGVKTREILPDSPANRADATGKNPAVNAVRFLSVKNSSESDLVIFDNQAALVSFAPENPFALVVSEPEMVASLKNLFTGLWEKLG